MAKDITSNDVEIGLPDWLGVTLDSIFTSKGILLSRAAGPAWHWAMGWAPVPAAAAVDLIDIIDGYRNGTSWDVQQQWQGWLGSIYGAAAGSGAMAMTLGPGALTPPGVFAIGLAGIAGSWGGNPPAE
ncbi:hypothetical protein [Ensifer sp. 4252]|uniref:hypothetical protein n=1 Tax=Ensifer sp. 4252 TaxID=3373915 RepID=UPI003D1E4E70